MASYTQKGTQRSAFQSSIFHGIVPSIITAYAGGGKANATPTRSGNVKIETVATAADSVLLPAPRAGDMCWINNAGANAAQLFGAGSSTINGAATGTGVSLAAGKLAFLTAYTAGAWTMVVLN